MGKGNNSTRTITSATPWAGVDQPLRQAVGQAGQFYNQGAPDYFPGNTVAPFSQYTQGAIDQQAQRAQMGSPLMDAGKDQLQQTLQGDFLNANPHFNQAVQSAIRPVTEQYRDVVMPGINSTFSEAGRYGSGAHQAMQGQAATDYERNVGDISSNMAYQNWAGERENQLKAGLLAPQMAQQDYFDINQLGAAGSLQDQQAQRQINADIARHDYNQNSDMQFLSNYMGLLQQAPWGQNSTVTPPPTNPFTSAMGGGIMGGMLAAPTGGMSIPMGALLGGGAGLLGSFF